MWTVYYLARHGDDKVPGATGRSIASALPACILPFESPSPRFPSGQRRK